MFHFAGYCQRTTSSVWLIIMSCHSLFRVTNLAFQTVSSPYLWFRDSYANQRVSSESRTSRRRRDIVNSALMLLFDAADKCSDIHGSFGLYVDYSVPLGHLPQDDRDDKADSLCYRDRVPDEIISEDERQEVDADEVEYDASARVDCDRVRHPLCGEQVGRDDNGRRGENIVQAVLSEESRRRSGSLPPPRRRTGRAVRRQRRSAGIS